ncbi:MAG: hypothetical protein FWG93_00750, partial [Oscillospiraceae bacterium]|nr:hypothetical protein [Oscillospiraceae bacterium]
MKHRVFAFFIACLLAAPLVCVPAGAVYALLGGGGGNPYCPDCNCAYVISDCTPEECACLNGCEDEGHICDHDHCWFCPNPGSGGGGLGGGGLGGGGLGGGGGNPFTGDDDPYCPDCDCAYEISDCTPEECACLEGCGDEDHICEHAYCWFCRGSGGGLGGGGLGGGGNPFAGDDPEDGGDMPLIIYYFQYGDDTILEYVYHNGLSFPAFYLEEGGDPRDLPLPAYTNGITNVADPELYAIPCPIAWRIEELDPEAAGTRQLLYGDITPSPMFGEYTLTLAETCPDYVILLVIVGDDPAPEPGPEIPDDGYVPPDDGGVYLLDLYSLMSNSLTTVWSRPLDGSEELWVSVDGGPMTWVEDDPSRPRVEDIYHSWGIYDSLRMTLMLYSMSRLRPGSVYEFELRFAGGVSADTLVVEYQESQDGEAGGFQGRRNVIDRGEQSPPAGMLPPDLSPPGPAPSAPSPPSPPPPSVPAPPPTLISPPVSTPVQVSGPEPTPEPTPEPAPQPTPEPAPEPTP